MMSTLNLAHNSFAYTENPYIASTPLPVIRKLRRCIFVKLVK
jgi:hypothetical protein